MANRDLVRLVAVVLTLIPSAGCIGLLLPTPSTTGGTVSVEPTSAPNPLRSGSPLVHVSVVASPHSCGGHTVRERTEIVATADQVCLQMTDVAMVPFGRQPGHILPSYAIEIDGKTLGPLQPTVQGPWRAIAECIANDGSGAAVTAYETAASVCAPNSGILSETSRRISYGPAALANDGHVVPQAVAAWTLNGA